MTNIQTVDQLQEIVKAGVHISEHNGIIYADFVEDNGDEFRLTQSGNISDVHEYLESHNLLEVK